MTIRELATFQGGTKVNNWNAPMMNTETRSQEVPFDTCLCFLMKVVDLPSNFMSFAKQENGQKCSGTTINRRRCDPKARDGDQHSSC